MSFPTGQRRADARCSRLTPTLPAAGLIVDALGYSLAGAPRPPISLLIRAANISGISILALDIPSGLDGDRGTPQDPCIAATSALTLALPKAGG